MSILSRIARRNVGRHLRRSIITAIAMGIGAAMCIATVSFTDGWLFQMFETVVGKQVGHAQIHSPEYPRQRQVYETIEDPGLLIKKLDTLPLIAGVSPRAYGFALLAVGEEASGVQLSGIDPKRERDVTGLADSMVSGEFLDDSRRSIILGTGVAQSLRAKVGDEVVALTQSADGSMGNELFMVKGIYRTGSTRLDRGAAFITLEDIQDLLVLGSDLHEIALRAHHMEDIDALVRQVEEATSGRELLVRSWAQIDPGTAQMLGMMDAVVWVFLFFIFSVASLGILNTMLMSVFERIRELGVLQALGLRPIKVFSLVMWETLYLSLLAALMGGSLGVFLAYLLQTRGLDLSGLIGDISYGGMVFEPLIFGELRLDRVLIILGFMVVISFVASLWPAIRAARLDPVMAMRQN